MVGICRFRWGWLRHLGLALVVSLLSFHPCRSGAEETDNFCLPLDVEMADVGDWLGAVHTRALEAAIQEANAGIERALAIQSPAERARQLERWHAPDSLAHAVARQFGAACTESCRVERALRGDWAKRSFPGRKVTNHGLWMNFAGHCPADPRALSMLRQAHTVKAYGVYLGTDKLTHFHQLGWSYFKSYRSLRRDGVSEAEAYRQVLQRYAHTALFAEANLFGAISTGVYSNSDMAVNHIGFKFYVNLTEKVIVKGRERAPLVVRCGCFWRLNYHVRPQSGWLRPFFSDHWNEALNPSLYAPTMRPGIRRVLRRRADAIVQFYTGKDGRPNDPAYFEDLACELATYYGEAYGHSGRVEKLMNIGNTCFPALHSPGQ